MGVGAGAAVRWGRGRRDGSLETRRATGARARESRDWLAGREQLARWRQPMQRCCGGTGYGLRSRLRAGSVVWGRKLRGLPRAGARSGGEGRGSGLDGMRSRGGGN